MSGISITSLFSICKLVVGLPLSAVVSLPTGFVSLDVDGGEDRGSRAGRILLDTAQDAAADRHPKPSRRIRQGPQGRATRGG